MKGKAIQDWHDSSVRLMRVRIPFQLESVDLIISFIREQCTESKDFPVSRIYKLTDGKWQLECLYYPEK